MGVSIAFGVWLGSGMQDPLSSQANSGGWDKVQQIIQYVENDYVDTISGSTLEEEVIAYLLQRLDPHSHYIREADLAAMNEPLDGNFEGIGVQFNLRDDSVYVVSVIAGGPSAKAGLLPGDRIVEVNGELIAGSDLTNQSVMAYLKGPEGTEVEVGIKRMGVVGLLHKSITRGQIPISSFDATYLLNDSTIYVKLARFAKTTHDEFVERVYPLKSSRTNSLILDLRGNGGGYLEAAVQLADEFLGDGMLITYTEGKNRPRQAFHATARGSFEDIQLVVIIDGYSASASEIIAGAIQDLGRGRIVGRRSFGKGLVQEQNEWKDGSATRLTVARYYTPSGRSIQRPYESVAGHFANGIDSLRGGIVPDIVVDQDTAGITWLYAELIHSGVLMEFAYAYRDAQLDRLMNTTPQNFSLELSRPDVEAALRKHLTQMGTRIDEREWGRSISKMTLRIQAMIGRSIHGDQLYYQLYNPDDLFVQTALIQLKKPA
jgi:carboxyl-terminal processing protease